MSKRFGAIMASNGDYSETSATGRISSTGSGGKKAAMSTKGTETKNMLPIGPYGIAGNPPQGLMAYAIYNQGGKDGYMVYDKNRPSVNAGNTTVYNSKGTKIELDGSKIKITSSGNLTISANGTTATFGGGDLVVNGISVTKHTHTGVHGGTSTPH